MKLIHRKTLHAPDGSTYLRRWSLHLPFGFAVMLHHMVRPDFGRELHDHPWPFATLVLKGGYFELYSLLPPTGDPGASSAEMRANQTLPLTEKRVRWNGPGQVRRNGALHTHRILDLPNGPAWTLVWRGRRCREWGFHTDCGWMHWRRYVDRLFKGKPICEDE